MSKDTSFVLLVLFIALLCTIPVYPAPPPISYIISIDPANLSGFDVEMRIPRARGTLRVAMAAHPEYDDRYWRYIERFSAVDPTGYTFPFAKEEDAVWRIENVKGDIIIRYRLRLPAQTGTYRDTWKPFLTPHGGMVGDLHSLMYVVGRENARARITLLLPDKWKAASGLETTQHPQTFTGSTELILDSPIMIGNLTAYEFRAGGVPHKVVFWSAPDGPAFDANAIVSGVRKLAEQAIAAFGPPPYPRYAFLFQNAGQGALEHLTSVNLSVPSSLEDLFDETAHEYIHVWNLMDVRSRERVGVRFKFAEPTGVLWWNEGATIMFADLMIRRAGVAGESRTRLQRLESALARYLTSPGYYTLSAEQVSRGDSHPLLLGDNSASTHLQGEVLSTMLDFQIRDATDGRRDITDVMRLLARRFDYRHGITNADIQRAAADVCSCDVSRFFRDYIYGAGRIDFDHYLSLVGIHADIGTTPAVAPDGKPLPDIRIGPMAFGAGVAADGLTIRITNPNSAWARAGLHTGDTLVSIDGAPVATWSDLRGHLQRVKIGDTPKVTVRRAGQLSEVRVLITGYDIATVRLTETATATAKQERLRESWKSSK